MNDCRSACYMLGHFVEDAELLRLSFCKSMCDIDSLKLPITNLSQAMVQDIVSLLCRLSWVSDNMHNRHEFGIAAGDGTMLESSPGPKVVTDGTDAVNFEHIRLQHSLYNVRSNARRQNRSYRHLARSDCPSR